MVIVDVVKCDEVFVVVEKIVVELGDFNVIVNNVGVVLIMLIDMVMLEDFDYVYLINVGGVIWGI